jgi:cytidine deaminase
MSDLLPLMINKAKDALSNSYSPYSNFKVACCISDDTDNIYTGVNIENSSYGLTICAEAAAISQFITAGMRQIKDVVILNGENTLCTPCGGCRQQLLEFSTPETRIHLCDHDKELKNLGIDELLPLAFKF